MVDILDHRTDNVDSIRFESRYREAAGLALAAGCCAFPPTLIWLSYEAGMQGAIAGLAGTIAIVAIVAVAFTIGSKIRSAITGERVCLQRKETGAKSSHR